MVLSPWGKILWWKQGYSFYLNRQIVGLPNSLSGCNTLSYLYQASDVHQPLEKVSSYNTHFNEGDIWPPEKISVESAESNQPDWVVDYTHRLGHPEIMSII